MSWWCFQNLWDLYASRDKWLSSPVAPRCIRRLIYFIRVCCARLQTASEDQATRAAQTHCIINSNAGVQSSAQQSHCSECPHGQPVVSIHYATEGQKVHFRMTRCTSQLLFLLLLFSKEYLRYLTYQFYLNGIGLLCYICGVCDSYDYDKWKTTMQEIPSLHMTLTEHRAWRCSDVVKNWLQVGYVISLTAC